MTVTEPTKILVSGGWGYGNLGDDAILISTLKILREKYPVSEIVVMTYDCEETTRNINRDDVRVISSLHRYLVGDLSSKRFRNITKSHKTSGWDKSLTTVLEKIRARINKKLLFPKAEKISYKKYLELQENPSSCYLYNEFQQADLFILGGGGYFNDGWVDNVYAHSLELIFAGKSKIRSLVIGQSIGPFAQKDIREVAVKGLKNASLISVRDAESQSELADYNLDSSIIPDTAISEISFEYVQKDEIAIVIGGKGLDGKQIALISNVVAQLVNNGNLSVKIILTRLWIPDVLLAEKLFGLMSSQMKNVSLIIPKTYIELQNELGTSRLLISQNLHGLIMAWRTGVPVISLSNDRKFVGFMKQSNQMSGLVPIKTATEESLLNAISNALMPRINENENRNHLAEGIKSKFFDILDKVNQMDQLIFDNK